MKRCIECRREYERDSGLMINLCDECCATLKDRPPAFVHRNGLVIPNPEVKKCSAR